MNMQSFKHGLIVAVGGFLLVYGASLVHLIPQNIADMTVGSLASGLIGWITHKLTTQS